MFTSLRGLVAGAFMRVSRVGRNASSTTSWFALSFKQFMFHILNIEVQNHL